MLGVLFFSVEGDACSTFLLLGVPSTESCGDGLYCDQHTHRCHPIVKRDLECARDQYKYMQSGLIGKMFNCAPNGNYASVGCTGSVCYCIDQSGNQVGVSTIPIGQQDALNC
ncbi:hypothetical protein MAR_035045 [Mya arenaria]|uniref:Thyroglobulin type-1 domain-containing protein n=1 Tax=Mya arenaria TaxID=6604 RepID=A0ABY7ELT4_MYAAR|nr:hypothetical protein MAR_035045 [Mya arenaria]